MPINPLIPLTLDFTGTMLIGFAVLKVHSKLEKETKLDKHIHKIITKEKHITWLGLFLIALGFILSF